jgi:hypothetical protein
MNDLPADIGALADHWRRAAPGREALRLTRCAGLPLSRSATRSAGRRPAASWAAALRSTWPASCAHVHDCVPSALACLRARTVLVPLAYLIPAAAGLVAGGVLRHCRERLAAYKCPARLVVVDDLPRNATGKVVKAELRSLPGLPDGKEKDVSDTASPHADTRHTDAAHAVVRPEFASEGTR